MVFKLCPYVFFVHNNPKFTSAVTMSQSVMLPTIIPSSCWAKIRHTVTDQKTDCISFLAISGGPPGVSWSPEGQVGIVNVWWIYTVRNSSLAPVDNGVGIMFVPILATLAGMLVDGAAAVPTKGCMHAFGHRKQADVCKSMQDWQIYVIFKNACLKLF